MNKELNLRDSFTEEYSKAVNFYRRLSGTNREFFNIALNNEIKDATNLESLLNHEFVKYYLKMTPKDAERAFKEFDDCWYFNIYIILIQNQ